MPQALLFEFNESEDVFMLESYNRLNLILKVFHYSYIESLVVFTEYLESARDTFT